MKEKRRNLYIIIGLALIFFILLIFPNATGAKDSNMLAVFEIDEFAQYPHFIRMLTPGDTTYQSLRNFFVYLHYFYGYLFYFFSALVSAPIKLIFGSDWINHSQLILTNLRQMITVIPMLVSILLWINMFIGFKSLWKAITSFVILFSIPAVFSNNFWWHPDSLAFLWVTLTFSCFFKDNLTFKRFFWIASLMTGFAIGTKHLGEFFVLVVPLYLSYGVINKRITWRKAIGLATGFITVMVLGIIISNPLLLLPIERSEIIRYQLIQWRETTQGSLLAHKKLSLNEIYHYLSSQTGGIIFLLLAAFSLIYNLIKNQNRWKYSLIFVWLIPYGLMIFGGSSLRNHYLIPFVIPLFAAVMPLIPDLQFTKLKKPISMVLIICVLFQLGTSLFLDFTNYIQVLDREKNSESIHFYQIFQNKFLTQLSQPPQKVFRDWQVYVPIKAPFQVVFDWNNASYPLINTQKPDILLLEQSRITLFSGHEPGTKLARDVDGSELVHFYTDAANNQVQGYDLIFENNFAKIFSKRTP